MLKKPLFLALSLALGFLLLHTPLACTPTTTKPDGSTETTTDGSTTKEETPEPAGPVTFTFNPATGTEIAADLTCIKVTFSRAVARREWKVEFKGDGESAPTPVGMKFKSDTEAEICPFAFLKQGINYNLTLEVKEKVAAGQTAQAFNDKASYKVKDNFSKEKPAEAGLAVNLQLKDFLAPAGISDLLGSLGTDQIPPILITMHTRDSGSSGNLLFVGGLGKAPEGQKPHQGQDLVDTKTPVSLALAGKYDGRWFAVGPTTFVLSVAGFNLVLEDFALTGVFSVDGKNIESARLTGVLDPAVIKERFNLDVCQLVRDECVKDATGKTIVRVAINVNAIANPLPFAFFITNPVYLQTGYDPAQKLVFYTNEPTELDRLTFKLFTCKGSSNEEKPCDEKEGAKIEPVAAEGKASLKDSKKEGDFTLPAVDPETWYRIEVEAKDSKDVAFKTFAMFKTKK